MAAASPALSSNSTDTSSIAAAAPAAVNALTNAVNTSSSNNNNTGKNQRGLNKPKCIKCGNVARSRCPYQSCKSCCAKAQNPCHIHVLKGNSSFPDKAPSAGSSLDQQSSEVPSSGNSHRVTSLRQLSNTFHQFNNLQSPLRSRKPLTRKDAVLINEWRFLKLKEYRNRNIEAENEAFDRYMQNVSLLEEVFAVNSTLEEPTKHNSPVSKPDPNSEENTKTMSNPDPNSERNNEMISGLKLKLRSDPDRTENFRKRVQYIVDQGLRKLKNFDTHEVVYDLGEEVELIKRPKKARYTRAERAVALRDLSDKLSKARNEEDIKSCLEMKAQLFDTRKMTTGEESGEIENKQQYDRKDESPKHQWTYSPPKWFSTITVDQDALDRMDSRFCSLEEIEDL